MFRANDSEPGRGYLPALLLKELFVRVNYVSSRVVCVIENMQPVSVCLASFSERTLRPKAGSAH